MCTRRVPEASCLGPTAVSFLVGLGVVVERPIERLAQRRELVFNVQAEVAEHLDDALLGKVALIRGALATLPGWDATAGVGAEALERLLELRGMEYTRAAVLRWAERLP